MIQSSSKSLGLIAGAISALIFTLVMFALRLFFGATTLPEILQALVLTIMPGEIQSFIIDTFQRAAKPMLFVILVTGQVVAGGALGILFASFHKQPASEEPGSESWLPSQSRLLRWGTGYALAIWVVSEVLVLIAGASPSVGIALSPSPLPAQAFLLLSHLVYGVSLALLYHRLILASSQNKVTNLDSGRRQVISWLALGSVGVLLGTGLWRLISQSGTSASTGSRKAVTTSPQSPEGSQAGLITASSAGQVSAPEGLFITEGVAPDSIRGMPLEVTSNEDFYLVSKNFIDPEVSAATWKLKIDGLVEQPFELPYEELRKLPSVKQYATLTCISNEIGGDLISTALWTGVPLKDLLARARLKPGVKDIALFAADGYSESIPPDKALQPNTIVAYEMNGVPLPSRHGFPARLIVPGRYGIKNVKWITGVQPVASDFQGFWQDRGWTDEGVIKTSSQINAPALRGPQTLNLGVTLGGIAFSGDRGIARVEVSTDDGKTWHEATLKDPLSPYTWVLWGVKWLPLKAGTYNVKVRATDKAGEVQTKDQAVPFPEGASGYHQVQLRILS